MTLWSLDRSWPPVSELYPSCFGLLEVTTMKASNQPRKTSEYVQIALSTGQFDAKGRKGGAARARIMASGALCTPCLIPKVGRPRQQTCCVVQLV